MINQILTPLHSMFNSILRKLFGALSSWEPLLQREEISSSLMALLLGKYRYLFGNIKGQQILYWLGCLLIQELVSRILIHNKENPIYRSAPTKIICTLLQR